MFLEKSRNPGNPEMESQCQFHVMTSDKVRLPSIRVIRAARPFFCQGVTRALQLHDEVRTMPPKPWQATSYGGPRAVVHVFLPFLTRSAWELATSTSISQITSRTSCGPYFSLDRGRAFHKFRQTSSISSAASSSTPAQHVHPDDSREW